jgi:SAM-dependent methyltransferase
MDQYLLCPVCNEACSLLDVVDFNKSCEEARGKFLGLAGIPVYYALCGKCGFCFAPELVTWELEEFEERIYNDEYVFVDPDYIETRPRANAANLIAMFGDRARSIKHLDYGGGSGLLAKVLSESSWQSISYDPFVDRNVSIEQLGKFDLITAFEVFEHVPDVQELMSNLRSLLSQNGLVLFSTLLLDGNINSNQRISWWYASPRNGHISLFSRKSLVILAQDSGLNFGSFSEGSHVFFTKIPPWADHILRVGAQETPSK